MKQVTCDSLITGIPEDWKWFLPIDEYEQNMKLKQKTEEFCFTFVNTEEILLGSQNHNCCNKSPVHTLLC